MTKKILSILLVIALSLSLFPTLSPPGRAAFVANCTLSVESADKSFDTVGVVFDATSTTVKSLQKASITLKTINGSVVTKENFGSVVKKITVNDSNPVNFSLFNTTVTSVPAFGTDVSVSFAYTSDGLAITISRNDSANICGDAIVKFFFEENDEPQYNASVATADELQGSVSPPTKIDANIYALVGIPFTGYIFDHWEYANETTENAYVRDEEHTAATVTVTITEDTTYRAHFHPVAITKLEREAYLYSFITPGYWVGSEPDPWYYTDIYLRSYNWCRRDDPGALGVEPLEYASSTPARAGQRAMLYLPVAQVDGTVNKMTPITYELYFGTEDTPAYSGSGSIGDANATQNALRLGFYIQSFPSVSTVKLVLNTTDADGEEVTFEQTYRVNPIGGQETLVDPINVYMSVEKLTVGTPPVGYESMAKAPGFIVEPIKFPVERGSNAAQAIESLLYSKDIGIEYTGSLIGSFYLAAIRDMDDPSGDTWLREKEYGIENDPSGWMYTVNNVFPEVSAADITLSEGDVIRWQFSKDGGPDIGVTSLGAAGSLANKDALLAKVAQISADGMISNYGTDYETALSILKTINTSSAFVNLALSALNNGNVTANNGELQAALSSAASLKTALQNFIGNGKGQYPQSAWDAFTSVIKTATEIKNDESVTQNTVDQTVTEINEAIKSFTESKSYYDSASFGNVLELALAKVGETANPTVDSIGGEWAVIALARGGAMTDEIRNAYLANLKSYVENKAYSKTNGTVILDNSRPTENERVVLALTALGIDASNWEGYDFVTPLLNASWANSQGINGTVFALIALDSKPYFQENTAIRNALVSEITAKQATNNGWSYQGTGFDYDMTAMALQALAPYRNNNSGVQNATTNAFNTFRTLYTGAWGAHPEKSSAESYAQTLAAYSVQGVDVEADGLLNNGESILDRLMSFALSTGAFQHILTSGANTMATEQAAYALVAYDRFKNGQNSLYDMSDAFAPPPPVQYAVTVQNDGNGTASADITSAASGTAVTLTATPKDGEYRFKEWQVVSGGVTINGNSFTMPESAVTVKAIFELIPATVTTVTVTPVAAEVQQGGTQSFTAEVTGEHNPPQTVTWNVGGNESSATVISESGQLTVAADETAEALTVTATSAYDDTKYGAAEVTVTETPPEPTYGITVSPIELTFQGAQEGYGGQEALTVTVTNIGNQPTGVLIVALDDDSGFTLSETTLNSIESGAAEFTVTPKTGLAAGTHVAAVTVSGENDISATLSVSFEVTAAPQLDEDAEAVTAVKALIPASLTSTSAQVTNMTNARAYVQNQLAALELDPAVTIGVAVSGFTGAANGAASNPGGTDGGFTATLTLTKGAAADTATITVTISAQTYTPPGSGNQISVSFRLVGATYASEYVDFSAAPGDYKGAKYVTWIPTTNYTLDEGATVYDLLKQINDASLIGIHTRDQNNYLDYMLAPAVVGGYKLGEFTNGRYDGWMYTLNGRHPGLGISEQRLYGGETIVWHYVFDYRYEVNDWSEGTKGSDATFNKWLDAENREPTAADRSENAEPPKAPSTGAGPIGGGDTGKTIDDDATPLAGAPENSVTVEIPATVTDGKATVEVQAETVKELIAEAKEDGKTNVTLSVTNTAGSNTVELDVIAGTVTDLARNGMSLTVRTDKATITLDTATLTAIAETAKDGETVKIAAEAVDTSVIDLNITVGSAPITAFVGTVTVSVPYTPEAATAAEDYDLLTVYHLDDDGNITEMKGAKYDAATGKITFATTHFSKFLISEWINPFTDIAKGEWYYKAARYAYSNALITGTTDTTFAPQATLTRAMLATILYRNAAVGDGVHTVPPSPETPFTDVASGQWYTPAIAWASSNNLITGIGNNKFAPNDPITREQFATLLYRYTQWFAAGNGTPRAASPTDANLSAYTDAETVSDWAREAMVWAVSTGLITGRTETTLAPKTAANRAEAAMLLQRYLETIM
jgi:hypothetical protein